MVKIQTITSLAGMGNIMAHGPAAKLTIKRRMAMDHHNSTANDKSLGLNQKIYSSG